MGVGLGVWVGAGVPEIRGLLDAGIRFRTRYKGRGDHEGRVVVQLR